MKPGFLTHSPPIAWREQLEKWSTQSENIVQPTHSNNIYIMPMLYNGKYHSWESGNTCLLYALKVIDIYHGWNVRWKILVTGKRWVEASALDVAAAARLTLLWCLIQLTTRRAFIHRNVTPLCQTHHTWGRIVTPNIFNLVYRVKAIRPRSHLSPGERPLLKHPRSL